MCCAFGIATHLVWYGVLTCTLFTSAERRWTWCERINNFFKFAFHMIRDVNAFWANFDGRRHANIAGDTKWNLFLYIFSSKQNNNQILIDGKIYFKMWRIFFKSSNSVYCLLHIQLHSLTTVKIDPFNVFSVFWIHLHSIFFIVLLFWLNFTKRTKK